MKIQTILVGLDWGETAEATAGLAVELAIALKASVKALYVEDAELIRAAEQALRILPATGQIPMEAPNMPMLEAEFQAEEKLLGRRFLRLVADTRIRGSFLVAQGAVDQILLQESRAHDLLVVGKYSENPALGGSSRPLGKHVERIVRHAWCPVALVPPGATLGPRILVAYDDTEASHRALSTALGLAQRLPATLRVLAIGDSDATGRLLDRAGAYLDSHHVEGDLIAAVGPATARILRETEEWGADLVAMGAFGPARRRESFGAGVTLDVLEALPCAALLCGGMEED